MFGTTKMALIAFVITVVSSEKGSCGVVSTREAVGAKECNRLWLLKNSALASGFLG